MESEAAASDAPVDGRARATQASAIATKDKV
jgi:hypothetical protein